MNRIVALVIGAVAILLIAASALFVVDQRRFAVVLAFGEVKDVVVQPGLHVKLPFPFASVTYLDRRLQTLDAPDPDRLAAAGNQELLVDVFVKWRISDPRAFYRAFKVDQSLARERLSQMVRALLATRFAALALDDVVAQANALAEQAAAAVRAPAAAFGIAVQDVRIKRLDPLASASAAAYRRMSAVQAEAARVARSVGAARAEQIRADAERARARIMANAYKQAQTIRGEGDAQAAAIYADAYNRDPKFYAFYQSLKAYRHSFHAGDLIVVDPSSAFFRFMRDPGSALPPSPASKP